MEKWFKLLLLVVMVIAVTKATGSQSRQRNVRYGTFSDYLVSVVSKKPRAQNQVLKPGARSTTTTLAPESPTQESEPSDSSDAEEGEEDDDGAPAVVEDRDVLGYFRDVPLQHWSCCMLGILAGDKGFHCHVQFYATRIARNNRNRAHSRKMMFHGRDAVENWGRDIMTTFGRCVTTEEGEFHRCCRTATEETRERRRWQTYRQQAKK